MNARDFVKSLIPPIFVHSYNALRSNKKNDSPPLAPPRLLGDYPSWQLAQADSTGYDAAIILEKTKTALLKVKRGEAIYERDSVLFGEIQYAWPFLTGLMWAAARGGGTLNVLDFGGSLGSSYFQNRAFLSNLRAVRWNVVEQVQQVEVGKCWFEDENLKFYASVEECLAETQPQVIVLGSVLQYLERPYTILDELLKSPCDYLIIDRTPFWDGPTDRLCVQHVPTEIYPASYPSWIFSTQRFHAFLDGQMEIVAEFDNPDRLPGPVDFAYRGLIATRRKTSVS